MKRHSLILLILLTAQSAVYGQVTLTGKIVDENTKQPVANAVISVKNKKVATQTNYKGFFQLEVKKKDVLVIQAKGYNEIEIPVPASNSVQIPLKPADISFYELGADAFYRFIGRKIHYPKKAKENQIQGKVYVSFLADTAGRVTNINILQDVLGGCGEEVSLLLSALPGKLVPQEIGLPYILPVTFRLHGLKYPEEKKIKLPEGKLLTEMVVTGYIQ